MTNRPEKWGPGYTPLLELLLGPPATLDGDGDAPSPSLSLFGSSEELEVRLGRYRGDPTGGGYCGQCSGSSARSGSMILQPHWAHSTHRISSDGDTLSVQNGQCRVHTGHSPSLQQEPYLGIHLEC